jgi:hypothetical protein
LLYGLPIFIQLLVRRKAHEQLLWNDEALYAVLAKCVN